LDFEPLEQVQTVTVGPGATAAVLFSDLKTISHPAQVH
jgi:hypothetical protein